MFWAQQSVFTAAALMGGGGGEAALRWLSQVVNNVVWKLLFRCKGLLFLAEVTWRI